MLLKTPLRHQLRGLLTETRLGLFLVLAFDTCFMCNVNRHTGLQKASPMCAHSHSHSVVILRGDKVAWVLRVHLLVWSAIKSWFVRISTPETMIYASASRFKKSWTARGLTNKLKETRRQHVPLGPMPHSRFTSTVRLGRQYSRQERR